MPFGAQLLINLEDRTSSDEVKCCLKRNEWQFNYTVLSLCPSIIGRPITVVLLPTSITHYSFLQIIIFSS